MVLQSLLSHSPVFLLGMSLLLGLAALGARLAGALARRAGRH